MAQVPAQGQLGQPTQQQQVLEARLDDPLVSADYRGEIRDINDYFTLSTAFAARRKEDHKIAPLSEDPDKNFPHNDPAKQRELVRRLFDAMRNQIGILDGTVKKDANKQIMRDANGKPVIRENAVIQRMRDETNVRLELLAWGLLLAIRDAQLGDLYALEWAWGHNFKYQYFDSFIDRYNATLGSVKVSKKTAADLMEPSWSCRLANAPDHEVKRKKDNARGNKNKQTLLEEGASKRKRDREEQEGQEDDEDNHEAASHDAPVTPATPAVPATPAPRATRKTASRKQAKRSASDTPRRAAAGAQSAARGRPLGQSSSMPATPQHLVQAPEVVPQMTANNIHPNAELGPEIDHSDQFFGPTNNGWTPSFGSTAPPLARPETASASFQGPQQGLIPYLHDQSQQTYSPNASDPPLDLTASFPGHPLSSAHSNNNHFLTQVDPFGAQFTPETVSSPGIASSLANTPGNTATSATTPSYPPDTPFSSAPATPWSSYPSEPTSPHEFGSAMDDQQFDGMWDAHIAFWEDENPQTDF